MGILLKYETQARVKRLDLWTNGRAGLSRQVSGFRPVMPALGSGGSTHRMLAGILAREMNAVTRRQVWPPGSMRYERRVTLNPKHA